MQFIEDTTKCRGFLGRGSEVSAFAERLTSLRFV
jgi:hypothetical protein